MGDIEVGLDLEAKRGGCGSFLVYTLFSSPTFLNLFFFLLAKGFS